MSVINQSIRDIKNITDMDFCKSFIVLLPVFFIERKLYGETIKKAKIIGSDIQMKVYWLKSIIVLAYDS